VSEASKAAQARQAGEAPEARGARDVPDTPEAPQGWDDRETRVAGRAREAGQARQAPGARDSTAVRQFIQRFASLLADAGMPRMPARIFVALLTADTSRLTAEELAGLLKVSPAAVSGGVRYLIQVGLVSRETEPGSRRHVYVMPDNVWHEVLRVRDGIMMRWADAMRGGAEVLGAGTPAGTRLAESAMYFEFVSQELPLLLDRWEDYKAAHRD
jgi:DNA-binding transcriptional regulator GbsR (MarR family)